MEFFAGIGAGWMNLASLALGLLAWMLPVAAMIRTAARPRPPPDTGRPENQDRPLR